MPGSCNPSTFLSLLRIFDWRRSGFYIREMMMLVVISRLWVLGGTARFSLLITLTWRVSVVKDTIRTGLFLPVGPVTDNPWVTRRVPAPTPAWNPYPCSQVQVLMGMGMGLDHGLHMHRRGKEGTTLPVASIRVGWRSREGQTLPVMSIRVFRRSREGETLPVMSIRVFRRGREGETLPVSV